MTAAVPGLFPAVFRAVKVDYLAVLPILIVIGGALVGVVIEAFAPRARRHTVQVALTLVTLVAALAVLVLVSVDHKTITLGGSVAIDGPALLVQGAVLVFAILGTLLMAERWGGQDADPFTPMGAATPGSPQEAAASRAGWSTSEVFPLLLLSVAGMLVFPAAADLITVFVALEVLSLPLYVLTGLARRRRLLSQEASLKYFLLGAFSSAFFIFGAALLYAYSGSTDLATIAETTAAASPDLEPLLVPGILLVLVGLLFKIGAVPFHQWTPDAYQGAPTAVTAFMAAATKAAALGAILRVAYVGFEANRWDWRWPVILIALATMVVGSVLSVTQTDIKRLLAYSSIAHAGFILVGVLAFSKAAISGVEFYLAAYGLSVIAAFGVCTMVREGGSEASHLSQWAGLGKRHPVVASVFAFLMLAFAGIPLTSGFAAKFAVFAPAVSSGGRAGVVLVIVGVLCSAITAFVYVKLIVLMFFSEPTGEVEVLIPSPLTTIAITVGTVLTLVLGVVPSLLLDLTAHGSVFLR